VKQKNKTLKILLSILIVVLISLISFGGVYVKDKNRMRNVVPEYKPGMDFNGGRTFSIKPDDTVNTEYYDKEGNKVESTSIEEGKESEYDKKEIPVNSEDILNKENFDKTKKIIEERLNYLNVKEYEIRENSTSGELYITIPEDDYTDSIVSQMTIKGEFKIVDSEDENNVLIDGSRIKDVKVELGQQATGQVVFINIEFDKEGANKLQEISKIYNGETISDNNTSNEINASEDTEETNENSENLEEDTGDTDDSSNITKKQVSLVLDGETLLTTHFSEEVKDGILQLSMGGNTSTASEEELKDSLMQASNLAVQLKTDNLPITYILDENLNVKSEIDGNVINSGIIAGIVIMVIMIIYAIVRYKKLGILSMISLIGYNALLLITLRYTNVVLTITGIFAIALSTIMTYVFILNVLDESQKEEKAFKKVVYKFLSIYMPGLIVSIVFSFSKYLPIASFGMVMFYSLVIMLIYHGIITKNLCFDSENK